MTKPTRAELKAIAAAMHEAKVTTWTPNGAAKVMWKCFQKLKARKRRK